MDAIEAPLFFVCPISLEIMKDPVIISSGMTYDRISIEKWIFSGKNNTCPVTKHVLSDTNLTPNVTLRRLIQSWCTVNASRGIERCPTPESPISKTQLIKLLNETQFPQMPRKCLQKFTSFASYNETNKRSMEAAGAIDFLDSIVNEDNSTCHIKIDTTCSGVNTYRGICIKHSKISINHISDSGLKSLAGKVTYNDGKFIESLIRIMRCGSYESRADAVLLLQSMADDVADPMQLITIITPPDFFLQLVKLLRDQICPKATKATLKLLTRVCPLGRGNKIKAVEAGAVTVLIDLLLESTDKRCTEMLLVVLELLCQCADGRAELLNHGAGLAMVSKKILRVSQVASDRAVKILYSISKVSANTDVLQDFLSLGVVSKLFLVLQFEIGSKMNERAREILKQNAWAWKNSPCIPSNLLPI